MADFEVGISYAQIAVFDPAMDKEQPGGRDSTIDKTNSPEHPGIRLAPLVGGGRRPLRFVHQVHSPWTSYLTRNGMNACNFPGIKRFVTSRSIRF